MAQALPNFRTGGLGKRGKPQATHLPALNRALKSWLPGGTKGGAGCRLGPVCLLTKQDRQTMSLSAGGQITQGPAPWRGEGGSGGVLQISRSVCHPLPSEAGRNRTFLSGASLEILGSSFGRSDSLQSDPVFDHAHTARGAEPSAMDTGYKYALTRPFGPQLMTECSFFFRGWGR